mmetsp:Transcript_4783/g.2681  ORF Transcript_4783/g.2681 Transcript_4783/m.2681 type:complete len:83 (+) Transcript_4783:81-329(+)
MCLAVCLLPVCGSLYATYETHEHLNKGSGTKAVCVGLLPSMVGCFCIGFGLNRTEIRNNYSIEGSFMGDCCCHLWCHPCAMI